MKQVSGGFCRHSPERPRRAGRGVGHVRFQSVCWAQGSLMVVWSSTFPPPSSITLIYQQAPHCFVNEASADMSDWRIFNKWDTSRQTRADLCFLYCPKKEEAAESVWMKGFLNFNNLTRIALLCSVRLLWNCLPNRPGYWCSQPFAHFWVSWVFLCNFVG